MKRTLIGLVGAVLMIVMLPGVASADGDDEINVIATTELGSAVCDTAGVAEHAHVNVFSGVPTAQRTRGEVEFATSPLTAVQSDSGCVLELPFLVPVHSEPRAGGEDTDVRLGGLGLELAPIGRRAEVAEVGR